MHYISNLLLNTNTTINISNLFYVDVFFETRKNIHYSMHGIHSPTLKLIIHAKQKDPNIPPTVRETKDILDKRKKKRPMKQQKD